MAALVALLLREIQLFFYLSILTWNAFMICVLEWNPVWKAKFIDFVVNPLLKKFIVDPTEMFDTDHTVSVKSWRALCHCLILNMRKVARQGERAPNTTVLTLDGEVRRLLDFQIGGRPLVGHIWKLHLISVDEGH